MSVEKLWDCWMRYSQGKKWTDEQYVFWIHLERNLMRLSQELETGRYRHGSYRQFVVSDNKRREISVASVRDRIVHRLLYDYFVDMYNQTFFYDIWSCRQGKGLHGALERISSFLVSYPQSYVWRCDIKKFFESVDKEYLLFLLGRRVSDDQALNLSRTIIYSYKPWQKGMPIGNLTSQIFSNIYLHELDRIIMHEIKPLRYLRYGDDIILLFLSRNDALRNRMRVVNFIRKILLLDINRNNDIIIHVNNGVKFLGFVHYPSGRKLNRRNIKRVQQRISMANVSSYFGLIRQGSKKQSDVFPWSILNVL